MFTTQPPSSLTRSILSFTLAISTLLITAFHPPAKAIGDPLQSRQIRYVAPPLPADQGAPDGRRQGGASRGPCRNYEALTALTPINQQGKVWGLTTLDHPTFWFYVPSDLTPDVAINFVLQDEADRLIYEGRLALQPGQAQSNIVPVSIPTSQAALEVGKLYHWTFSIACNVDRPSSAVFVRGTVQRVAPSVDLEQQLAIANPLEQASLYAANGIWHEALTILATLKQTNPNDPSIQDAWISLLEQADLEVVSTFPIISCCLWDQITRTPE